MLKDTVVWIKSCKKGKFWLYNQEWLCMWVHNTKFTTYILAIWFWITSNGVTIYHNLRSPDNARTWRWQNTSNNIPNSTSYWHNGYHLFYAGIFPQAALLATKMEIFHRVRNMHRTPTNEKTNLCITLPFTNSQKNSKALLLFYC